MHPPHRQPGRRALRKFAAFAAVFTLAATVQACTATKKGPPRGVWDDLAQCEASGNWHNVNPPYFGGLQFLTSTWIANGGGQFAGRADWASRGQQITVAQRLHAREGFAPWPGCRAKLGLR